jgi:hypothetical protein
MGRRDSWRFKQLDEERAKSKILHPAWRGVGCMVIFLFGVLAYFFSGWFISSGLVYLPPEIRRPEFAPFLPQDMIVKLVVSILFMMLAYTAMSAIYAIAFPVELGETDAPPPRRKSRRRRRR